MCQISFLSCFSINCTCCDIEKHKTISEKRIYWVKFDSKNLILFWKVSIFFHVTDLLTVEMMRHKRPQKVIDFSSIKTEAETQIRTLLWEVKKIRLCQGPRCVHVCTRYVLWSLPWATCCCVRSCDEYLLNYNKPVTSFLDNKWNPESSVLSQLLNNFKRALIFIFSISNTGFM